MTKKMNEKEGWHKTGIVAVLASLIVVLGGFGILSFNSNAGSALATASLYISLVTLFVLLSLVDYLYVKQKGKMASRIAWVPNFVAAAVAALGTGTVLSVVGLTAATGLALFIGLAVVMFLLLYIGEWATYKFVPSVA